MQKIIKTSDIINKKAKTKIIATIGPATRTEEKLEAIFNAGVTCIRLNFSHGTYEQQLSAIQKTKKLEEKINRPISILLDTKGPEIRVGKIKGDKQLIEAGKKLKIITDEEKFVSKITTGNEFTVSYNMSKDLKKGDIVLVDDGKLKLIVDSVKPKLVEVTAYNKHILKTNKRINLPGIDFSLPFLSEKDIKDIIWGTQNGIDYIAASFVNTADNIKEIKKILKEHNAEHIQIIAKIESELGINNIDAIIKESDGIMVARGDLGLEIPYYDVPFWQKIIIRKCREQGKLVIVATQMLETMTDNPHPTRAEVTDVYYATELGADATMLSGETAAGLYPEIVIKTMSNINKRAEREFFSKIYYSEYIANRGNKTPKNDREKIAIKVAKKSANGDYKFAIIYSTTGQLLKEVSKLRPNVNIIGVSKDEKLYTSFGVWSSISMTKIEEYEKIGKDQKYAIQLAKKFGATKGDKIFVAHNTKIIDYKIN